MRKSIWPIVLMVSLAIAVYFITKPKPYFPEGSKWRVTAYCICDKCCPPPFNDGITASGAVAEGLIIAAPKHIPFGTPVALPDYSGVVQDRGTAIKMKAEYGCLDTLHPSHEAALEWGVKWFVVKDGEFVEIEK